MSVTIHGKSEDDPHGVKREQAKVSELQQLRAELSQLRGLAEKAASDSAAAMEVADRQQSSVRLATWLGAIGTLLAAGAALFALFK